jgi:glycosyltransferase involved in cell wall biosynthesis
MKLAIITSRYPSLENPYNHMFVHVRALSFKSQGVDVKIFVPSKQSSEYNYQGIEVVKDTSKEISKKLSSYDVFNVHLLNFFPLKKDGGLPIYNYFTKVKKPLMLGLHGADVFKYPEYLFDFSLTPKGITKYLYKNFWNYPHIKNFVKEINQWDNSAVVFPSNWMKNYTENHFKLTFTNPKVIANGINTELFSYKNLYKNRFKIITIRPFEKKYGVDQSIEIMKYLPEEFTLDIYGKGNDKKLYERLISDYQLNHRVKIHEKFIDRIEMNSLFHQYGIFFAFSLFDSQGVSMCEAMASGLLTITNENTALPEFVKNNKTGITGNKLKEVAEKIIHLVKDENEFTTITTNGRKSMEEIEWTKTGEKELEVLKSLVAKK